LSIGVSKECKLFARTTASSKRVRVLDQNAITEIAMDSDSEESYACEEMDEQQPGPSSRSED